MRTAFPAYQDALYTQVAAGVTLADVSLGWPAGGPNPNAQVWIAGNAEITTSDETSNYSSRDETITSEIRVLASRTTADYTEARDSLCAITDEIEDALSADPTLGGAVRFARVTNLRFEEAVEETSRTVGAILTVTADTTVA